MNKEIEHEARRRAAERCEYCHFSEAHAPLHFVLDHIIAQQHGGESVLENLALCCPHCNRKKGPNLAGWDRETQNVVRLFHPRQDAWPEHFEWRGPVLVGRTEIGRVTVSVLAINSPQRVTARQALIDEGFFESS